MIARQSAVLIVDIVGPLDLGDSWQPGPWPVPLPVGRFDHIYRKTANAAARSDFFLGRVHPLLYGEGKSVRAHRSDLTSTIAGWFVRAIDLLRYPEAVVGERALLAVHVWRNADDERPAEESLRLLANLRPDPDYNQGTGCRFQLETLIREVVPDATLVDARTGFVVSHTVWDQLPELPDEPIHGDMIVDPISAPSAGIGTVAAEGQGRFALAWPRLLASANTASAMSGELRSDRAQSFDLRLSDSWSAAVLKSGIGFVGISDASDPFHELAEALVHSTFLDAVLVALLQRGSLDDMANSTATVWQQSDGLRQMDQIERRSIQLRSQVWWEEISTTVHVNQVLRELQAQYRLADQMDRLHSEIVDMARYSHGRRAARTNQLLNVLVAASFGLGIAALIADPGLVALLAGVGLGLAVLVAMLMWERRDGSG